MARTLNIPITVTALVIAVGFAVQAGSEAVENGNFCDAACIGSTPTSDDTVPVFSGGAISDSQNEPSELLCLATWGVFKSWYDMEQIQPATGKTG